MKRSKNPKSFLTSNEKDNIDLAIKNAESDTSAQIKFVIARHCWTDIKTKAATIFKKFGLDKTQQRNCVLILLVISNREFLIYGDQGIHEKVGQDFWDATLQQMQMYFRNGKFETGITETVTSIGQKLAAHFPPVENSINEISDEVAYEN